MKKILIVIIYLLICIFMYGQDSFTIKEYDFSSDLNTLSIMNNPHKTINIYFTDSENVYFWDGNSLTVEKIDINFDVKALRDGPYVIPSQDKIFWYINSDSEKNMFGMHEVVQDSEGIPHLSFVSKASIIPSFTVNNSDVFRIEGKSPTTKVYSIVKENDEVVWKKEINNFNDGVFYVSDNWLLVKESFYEENWYLTDYLTGETRNITQGNPIGYGNGLILATKNILASNEVVNFSGLSLFTPNFEEVYSIVDFPLSRIASDFLSENNSLHKERVEDDSPHYRPYIYDAWVNYPYIYYRVQYIFMGGLPVRDNSVSIIMNLETEKVYAFPAGMIVFSVFKE